MKRITAAAAFSCLFVTVGISGVTAASASPSGTGKLESVLTGTGLNTEGGQLDGTWTLAFTPSGHLDISHNGKKVGNGSSYSISGSDLTIVPGSGGACTVDGVYSFVENAGNVTFQTVSDSCTTRNDVLTFGPWTEVR